MYGARERWGACFRSAITSEGQPGKAEQRHRPGRRFRDRTLSHHLTDVVDTVGDARPQVDDAAAVPLHGVSDAVDNALPHRLPGVVDTVGFDKCGAWQASQVDDGDRRSARWRRS